MMEMGWYFKMNICQKVFLKHRTQAYYIFKDAPNNMFFLSIHVYLVTT